MARAGGGGASGRPRRGRAEALESLVPSVLDDLGLDESARAVRLLRAWDEAVGAGLAAHCRPDGVRGDVLYARVADSAWMQRIQLQKTAILESLEAALGAPVAKDLRLRIGPLDA